MEPSALGCSGVNPAANRKPLQHPSDDRFTKPHGISAAQDPKVKQRRRRGGGREALDRGGRGGGRRRESEWELRESRGTLESARRIVGDEEEEAEDFGLGSFV